MGINVTHEGDGSIKVECGGETVIILPPKKPPKPPPIVGGPGHIAFVLGEPVLEELDLDTLSTVSWDGTSPIYETLSSAIKGKTRVLNLRLPIDATLDVGNASSAAVDLVKSGTPFTIYLSSERGKADRRG